MEFISKVRKGRESLDGVNIHICVTYTWVCVLMGQSNCVGLITRGAEIVFTYKVRQGRETLSGVHWKSRRCEDSRYMHVCVCVCVRDCVYVCARVCVYGCVVAEVNPNPGLEILFTYKVGKRCKPFCGVHREPRRRKDGHYMHVCVCVRDCVYVCVCACVCMGVWWLRLTLTSG